MNEVAAEIASRTLAVAIASYKIELTELWDAAAQAYNSKAWDVASEVMADAAELEAHIAELEAA